MPRMIQGVLAVLGRVMLSAIFLMSAAGNKIPHFDNVARLMGDRGIPATKVMLVGAIAFLIVGSLSIVLGYKARIGAALLLIFLVLATYYFHDFWNTTNDREKLEQMTQFLKNTSMMGAMLLIIANGIGSVSLDERATRTGAKGL